jgi:hypothetical protein
MLEKLGPSAEETVTQWMRAFNLALTNGDHKALAKLFQPDSHWRNLFGISWQLATSSGNEILCDELSRRASEVRATDFRVNTTALNPRRAIIAGREVIEAIICFDTINGPVSEPTGWYARRTLLLSPGRFRHRSTSTRSATRDQGTMHRFRMRVISLAATGSTSGKPRSPSTIASRTFSSSVAAMPAFRRRSN